MTDCAAESLPAATNCDGDRQQEGHLPPPGTALEDQTYDQSVHHLAACRL